MTFRPRDLTPEELTGLFPYQAPAGEYPVRLDANESPYPPPPDLAKEVSAAVSRVALNRYPDPGSRRLREAFAVFVGCRPRNVMAGNGSDELIALLYAAFRGSRKDERPVVLFPAPSFAMYTLSGRAAGFAVEAFPLSLPDLSLDSPGFVSAVTRLKPNLVFLAQPNNPTGTLHPVETVLAVLKASPGIVVVDEAYGDFSGEGSWVRRLPEFPNLAVLNTLSKVGGAALRCGFLAASEDILMEVEKVRGPFNVNALTQAAGEVILRQGRWIREQGAILAAGRDKAAAELARLGLTVFPSSANFLLVTAGGRERDLARYLAEGGIVVKSFSDLPVAGDALRITIGTTEEMESLLARVSSFMGRKR